MGSDSACSDALPAALANDRTREPSARADHAGARRASASTISQATFAQYGSVEVQLHTLKNNTVALTHVDNAALP
jgi:hypothetical protein